MSLINVRGLLAINKANRSFKRLYSNEISKCHYDIIIAGGGMVGTTLACTLGKKSQLQDKKILVLESGKEFKWTQKEKYSNRVVALTSSTQKLLDSIGAWDIIARTRFGSIKKMQIWEAYSDAMLSFNYDDLIDHVAYIVENDLLIAAVDKVVKDISNVTVINQSKIKDYILPNEAGNTVEVIMEGDKTYTCNLLLGADGAKSKVREKMGIQYLNWDYNRMGIVATVNLSEVDDNVVAWQRFIPTGTLAILPLNNSQSSLVWTTPTSHAKELLKMSEEQFVDELNNAFWKVYKRDIVVDTVVKNLDSFLGNLNLPSNAVRQLPPSIKSIEPDSRAAFPLGFGHATNYVAKSVALVGDAAHRVHPLAGQGVNLGFGDTSCLANLLAEAVYSGQSIGSLVHLREYETQRQRYNVPMMIAIDGMEKLYSSNLTPVVLLRTVGLQLTHAINPVKKLLMSYAKG